MKFVFTVRFLLFFFCNFYLIARSVHRPFLTFELIEVQQPTQSELNHLILHTENVVQKIGMILCRLQVVCKKERVIG